MNYLKQNKKIKASSKDGVIVYNFGIPARKARDGFTTCRKAKNCIPGCYARQGAYLWPVVANAYEKRLALARGPRAEFTMGISADIEIALKRAKGKQVYIRIHDSGDFFSLNYALAWMEIVADYPDVKFYAYTKEVKMLGHWELPENMRLVFSYGGKEDKLISPDMPHSRVFETTAGLKKAGYIDASKDDLLVFKGKKIGLAYHGNKKFSNTSWGKV